MKWQVVQYICTWDFSVQIVSTKEVYSYKTRASFGSIASSVNMNDVSFSKVNAGM